MVKDSRKIAAILAADVVEYSRLMAADEQGTLAALKVRRAIFDELVREFDGHEFGSVGDSLMAEFPSAVNSVLVRSGHPATYWGRKCAIASRAAHAIAHRRQSRRRHPGRRFHLWRYRQCRRTVAGVGEAGWRADFRAGLRPGPSQGPGAIHRRRHASGQEHRGTGQDLRGAAGRSAGNCRADKGNIRAHRFAARASRGAGTRGARRRRVPGTSRPGVHPPERESPPWRPAGLSGGEDGTEFDRGPAIREHERRSAQRLSRRRACRGNFEPPDQDPRIAGGSEDLGIRVQGQGSGRGRDRRPARRRLRVAGQRQAAGRSHPCHRRAGRRSQRFQPLVEYLSSRPLPISSHSKATSRPRSSRR